MRLEKPFLSLSAAGAYPAYDSLPFTFRTWPDLQTAKSGLIAAWLQWPPAKGQAGTRLKVQPKRPHMFASRNSFPKPIRIMLIVSWNQ
jgi:hypothetical protein